MKEAKICIIAVIVTALIICSCACALPACAEGSYYAKEALVIGWERVGMTETRVVIVVDEEGTLWDFYADDDFFKIGDVVILRMADLPDEIEENDEVVDVMLIEHLDGDGMMDWYRCKGLI